jgi:hypothetical protein
MSKLFRPAFFLILILCASSSVAFAGTFFIAASGSDSNNGTSKATPWKHFPGMHGCTSNCASYTPVAGDRFILKGGDTWVAADLGINFYPWSGTSGNPIYIGVDPTYYAGASWTRPKFDCQNTTCTMTGGAVLWVYASYVTLDNIELIGFQSSSGGTLVQLNLAGDEISNFYIHGFSRGSNVSHVNAISAPVAGTKVHDNVIDGEDSPNKDFMAGILHGDQVYNNVIRYVYNGFNGAVNDFHGNLVEYNYVAADGDHCNLVFNADTMSGNTMLVYNNVIRHMGCAGGTTLYTLANSNNTSSVAYQYNNILYDNDIGCCTGVGSGGHTATGVYWNYNNTVVSAAQCFGNGEAPATKSTTHYGNNHCITSGTMCIATGTTCIDEGGNLQQTLAQANSAGYNASQTYAYAPTSGSSPTVGTGANRSSFCSSGAGAAMCSDTTYPTYNSTNHTVVMRTVVSRPGSGAWDIGAYRFSANTSAPLPPANLTVVVQ